MLKAYRVLKQENIFLALLFLIVVSCRSDNKKQESSADLEIHSLEDCKTGTITDLFSEVQLIDLKYDGKFYPKTVDRVLLDSGMIILGDAKGNAFIYSEDGTPVSSSLSKLGEGPGEHQFSMGFSWNPSTRLVEILTPESLMFYDRDFNFIKSSRLQTRFGKNERSHLLFHAIYDLAPDLHLLSPTGTSEKPFRFIVYDSSQEKNVGEISYEDDVWSFINMQSEYFFNMPDGSIICHPGGLLPYTYQLDPQALTLNKAIKLEPDLRCISEKEINSLSGDNKEVSDYLLNCDKSIPINTMVTSDKMIVTLKTGNSIRGLYTVVFDRDGSDKKEYIHYQDDKVVFPPILHAADGYAYAVVDKDTLLDSSELYLNNPESIAALADFDDEDWVFLKYKFKKTL